MNIMQFIGLHLFEAVYLPVLAILPFVVVNPDISFTLLALVLVIGLNALYKKFTLRTIKIDKQRVFITGCDTGFGFALARRLSSRGLTVYAGCFLPDGDGAKTLKSDSTGLIKVIPLDVRSDESVTKAYDIINKHSNGDGLWCVVNNAAINFVGDMEFCTMEMFKRVAEVNMFGVVRVTKKFLPMVRKCKGRVVNITSAKGRIHIPANTCYGMAKYAIETFSDILRLEMRKFNVKVVVVEPGNFGGSTGMLSKTTLDSLEKDFDTMWTEADKDVKSAYGKSYLENQFQSVVDSASTAGKSISPVVDAMESAVIATTPAFRYLVDGSNSLIDYNNFIIRLKPILPDALLDWFLDREHNSWIQMPAAK